MNFEVGKVYKDLTGEHFVITKIYNLKANDGGLYKHLMHVYFKDASKEWSATEAYAANFWLESDF